MFKTPVRNIYGNVVKSGDEEAPLSTDRWSDTTSPLSIGMDDSQNSKPKFFIFSSNKSTNIDLEAEIEILKADLETEKEQNSSL
jgi:hypothetical protein